MAPRVVAGKQTPRGHGLPGPKPQKGESTMVKTFSKPQPARQLEARGRARTLGVRVAVVVEARRYVTASQSQPGAVYAIERTPAGWACSCDGYLHTGMCKHLGAVERRSEREGWAFGTVAPLAKVARYFPLDVPENVAIHGRVVSVEPAAPAPAPVADLDAARARRRAALAEIYGAAD